jgi:hypothetical protein
LGFGGRSGLVVYGQTNGSFPDQFELYAANTAIARGSSTGLAVTGALSATGTSGQIGRFESTINNNGQSYVYNRTASVISIWGVLHNAGTRYSYIGTESNDGFRIITNNADRVVIDSTGLAVTGALSASGEITGGTGSAGTQIYVATNTAGKSAARFEGVAGKLWVDLSGAGVNYHDAATHRFRTYAGGQIADFTSTGLAVTGALSATGALAIGNTVNTVSPTSPNRTVTIVIGGTTYYLAAKTTND